jgi:hypothetical protein
MNICKIYVFLAVLVSFFCILTFTVLSTPSLQWSGVDSFVWPIAIGFLIAAIAALLFPAIPYGRRAVAACPRKVPFAISYAILVCYAVTGITAYLLYSLRFASGI